MNPCEEKKIDTVLGLKIKQGRLHLPATFKIKNLIMIFHLL